MGPLLLWNDLHQVEFDLDRIAVLRQTDPLADPLDMGIHRDSRNPKGIAQDDIGCLPSHTREGHQFLQGLRDLSSESCQQLLAALPYGLRIISVESRRSDLLLDF